MTTEPLLTVKDLSIAFGAGERQVLAVDRISFSIKKGETLALVGESGSGKSATALSIMKLLPYPAASHPSGQVMFKGQELLSLSEREIREMRGDDITIIFQEPMTSLNPLFVVSFQDDRWMPTMNKIVRNYPASKLPADLREGLDPDARVTVTVQVANEAPPHRPMTLDEIFALRLPPYRSAEQIVADIRRLRDDTSD